MRDDSELQRLKDDLNATIMVIACDNQRELSEKTILSEDITKLLENGGKLSDLNFETTTKATSFLEELKKIEEYFKKRGEVIR